MISNASPAPSRAAVDLAARLLPIVEDWYESQRNRSGEVKTNVMCAGIYATDHLAGSFPLTVDVYRTDSQVKGAGGPQMKRILASHGETRIFLAEGGRTSRGTLPLVESLARVINEELLISSAVSDQERIDVAWKLQNWFVDKVRVDFFDRKRLEVEIDHTLPVAAAVAAMIKAGRDRGGNTAGAVAQHLVGAKLELRFPELKINNESYTTADQQTDRAGDFQIGDTGIHVTMSPSQALFTSRCARNLADGYRPRVLVPEDKVAAAVQLRELADLGLKVAIQSIEDFVGTNIEELAQFTADGVRLGLRRLLETYNQRVREAEVDLSLMIDIPKNL
jgi:hypothetical protein